MNDMKRIGHRIQHDARTTKHTGALADGPGGAGLAAGDFRGGYAVATFADDLFFAVWQQFDHVVTFTFALMRLEISLPFMRSSAQSSMTFAPKLR